MVWKHLFFRAFCSVLALIRNGPRPEFLSLDFLSNSSYRALDDAAKSNGQPVKHGIIVDDPVSSLDHISVLEQGVDLNLREVSVVMLTPPSTD